MVFCIVYENYVIEVFELGVVDYLFKLVCLEWLCEVL